MVNAQKSWTVNANKTCKVYLVIIIYVKRLINTYFVFATLRNNFDVMLKNAVKKKLSENQKKQNHAQVSHLFKNSFMLKNMQKKQTRFLI